MFLTAPWAPWAPRRMICWQLRPQTAKALSGPGRAMALLPKLKGNNNETTEDCRENKNTGVGAAAVLHRARLPENVSEPVTCEGLKPLTEHTFEHQKRISYVRENRRACAAAHVVEVKDCRRALRARLSPVGFRGLFLASRATFDTLNLAANLLPHRSPRGHL